MTWCYLYFQTILILISYCLTNQYNQDIISDSEWWKTSIIYQIYPRSFKDSDGDGIGDINGIISKVDYLASTGINAIWLSPIFTSPMVDFGYDVSDYKAIDPVFGTMKDFDNLRMTTKLKGIKLILDFVPNHSSIQHEWFQNSALNDTKYKDYYIWANGRVLEETYERLPPNNWLSSTGGSAWTWDVNRGQYYLHQYTSSQPDLNYRNKQVRRDMQDVLTFWLDKGVDGFRIDAVARLFEDKDLRHENRSGNPYALPGNYSSLDHIFTINLEENHELVAEWRNLVDKYSEKDGSDRIIFTECKGNLSQIISYYGNSTHPEAHFPFNFDLMLKITNNSKANDFKNIIDKWITIRNRNWLTGNHDRSRVASRLGQNMVDIMNMLVLLLPGTAITYNGEEIGMEDTPISWEEAMDPRCFLLGKKKCALNIGTRDPERTPFQWDDSDNAGFSTSKTWLPVNSNYKVLNLKNQMKSAKSHYKTYKRLAQARNEPAIQRGNFSIQASHDDLLIFSRELNGCNSFLVVMNLGEKIQQVDLDIYKRISENFIVYATSVNSPIEIDSAVSRIISLQPKEAVLLMNSPLPTNVNSITLYFDYNSLIYTLLFFVISIFLFLFCKRNYHR